MKKSELIAQLVAIPGDPEVVIFDWRKNTLEGDPESPAGIYQVFNVEKMDEYDHSVDDVYKPFIALSFANEDYDDEFGGEQKCRVCGCTNDDCTQCVEKTGESCHWVEDDLCSACQEVRTAPKDCNWKG